MEAAAVRLPARSCFRAISRFEDACTVGGPVNLLAPLSPSPNPLSKQTPAKVGGEAGSGFGSAIIHDYRRPLGRTKLTLSLGCRRHPATRPSGDVAVQLLRRHPNSATQYRPRPLLPGRVPIRPLL